MKKERETSKVNVVLIFYVKYESAVNRALYYGIFYTCRVTYYVIYFTLLHHFHSEFANHDKSSNFCVKTFINNMLSSLCNMFSNSPFLLMFNVISVLLVKISSSFSKMRFIEDITLDIFVNIYKPLHT